MFREGIQGLLQRKTDVEIVGQETDFHKAIEQIRELKPDIVIVEDGEDEAYPTTIMMGLINAGLKAQVIGLNLEDNTLTICRGEQLVIREVEDLMKAIKQTDLLPDMIGNVDWANLAAARSRVYGFLGTVYNRLPSDLFVENLLGNEMGVFLSSLLEVEDLPVELRAGLLLLQDYIRTSQGKPVEQLRTELAVDRTRLLRGVKPDYGPPPPYESVYKGTEAKPLMNISSAVQRIYAEAGVNLPEEVKDRPDFIGIELDYMRFLTEKEAEAWSTGDQQEALKILEKERTFLEEHITDWIPRFCEVMFQEAQLDFFKGIAQMTQGFVLSETEKVAEILEPAT